MAVPGGLGAQISQQLVKLSPTLSATLKVEELMLEHGGDSVSAAPQLLLPVRHIDILRLTRGPQSRSSIKVLVIIALILLTHRTDCGVHALRFQSTKFTRISRSRLSQPLFSRA